MTLDMSQIGMYKTVPCTFQNRWLRSLKCQIYKPLGWKMWPPESCLPPLIFFAWKYIRNIVFQVTIFWDKHWYPTTSHTVSQPRRL